MKAVKMHIIKNILYIHVKNYIKFIGKLRYETNRVHLVSWFLQNHRVPLITLLKNAHVDMWMYRYNNK